MAHLIEFPHHGRPELIGGVKVLVDDRALTVGWCSRMLYHSVFMCPDPPEYSRLSDRALPVSVASQVGSKKIGIQSTTAE